MGVFDKAERKIDSVVGKVFAKAFKGDVEPVEIGGGIQRELDAEKRLLDKGKHLVPNHFTVGLSQHDYERLYPYARKLNAEILPSIREHAATNHYVFNGPISIEYVLQKDLPVGQFTLRSEAVEGRSDTPGGRLVIEVHGVRHPLMPPGIVIGRGADADLRLNDPGVSRRHALIAVSGTPDRPIVTIEDLGSTNGVIVNGQKVSKTALREGARIELGNTRMLIHAPGEM
ncbi:DUF3662 and FHA domain-containing protein [Tessaracoccus sp. OH4464_COT-324]|uniref:FhaA domain-containing protein n=1 Tax=Tessaracoccus sp. OH4464_COT-324 TaxID=2491059 RepID=UPI000F62F09B|nr:DUF3662 and FHA domain-containing protein [Tessaracoccus sp. OH4464_COT-324]RRD45923.1 DUF2662 domain-containing protein [Tessaracoccus sp. OH4464_COT-324]